MGRAQKHLRRLILFVDELKRGRTPNAVSFAETLRRFDLDHNEDLAVCPKTVKRDIAYLRNVLNAPIEYDPAERGYVLIDRAWMFPFLQLEDDELFAALFTGHLGQKLLPGFMDESLSSAMEIQLAAGEPGKLQPELLSSLIIATGAQVVIDPAIFRTVIEAWRSCRRLSIQYQRPGAKRSVQRDVDVHALFLSDGAWYARIWCHLRDDLRNLALHRISNPELRTAHFQRSDSIVQEIHGGRLFNYPRIRNVVVHCDQTKAPVIREREWFPGQRVDELPDGSLRIFYPDVASPFLFRWILSYAGHLTVIEPEEMANEIRAAGERIVEGHGGSK